MELIYHIEREELFTPKTASYKQRKWKTKRTRNEDFIEFINGGILLDINEIQLNFNEKITIFFELMIIIEFLHRKGFIYRDLKPNNIIINNDNIAILIDFDQMIEEKNIEYKFHRILQVW